MLMYTVAQYLDCEYEPRSWLWVHDTTLCDQVCQGTMREVGGFLWVLRFPSSIKLTATI